MAALVVRNSAPLAVGALTSGSTWRVLLLAEVRGQANAVYRLLSWGALAVGALGAGPLVDASGAWTGAVDGAAVMARATIPVAPSPVHRMRSTVDPEVSGG